MGGFRWITAEFGRAAETPGSHVIRSAYTSEGLGGRQAYRTRNVAADRTRTRPVRARHDHAVAYDGRQSPRRVTTQPTTL